MNTMLNSTRTTKYLIGALCAYLLLIGNTIAQQYAQQANEDKLRRHQIGITYGVPFLGGALNGLVGPRLNIRSTTNHIGLRYAYLFNESTCFELEYTSATGFVNNKTFFTKHRALARVCFQSTFSEVFHFYCAWGSGLKWVSFSPKNRFTEDFRTNQNRIPFTYRACGGIKVWLFKCIGLHTEFGLGGPLLQFGLHFRFQTKNNNKLLD